MLVAQQLQLKQVNEIGETVFGPTDMDQNILMGLVCIYVAHEGELGGRWNKPSA